eukprot:TRINITY_DN21758_c0_g1_i4.p1 TRINITY_DN21758_c0_g1~~TRINITY_DN21758_c0_g1_i4.p1  ORF type:complete len:240 (+),score=80.06 TRINITY_DN21758_c0_g1_i4:629-1348(+)
MAGQEEAVMEEVEKMGESVDSEDTGKTLGAIKKILGTLRAIAKATMPMKKKGCLGGAAGRDGIVAKMRQVYVSSRGASVGKEAAAARFDEAYEMMKHAGTTKKYADVKKLLLFVTGRSQPGGGATEGEEDDDPTDVEDVVAEAMDDSEEAQQQLDATFKQAFAGALSAGPAKAPVESSALLQRDLWFDLQVAVGVLLLLAVALFLSVELFWFFISGALLTGSWELVTKPFGELYDALKG